MIFDITRDVVTDDYRDRVSRASNGAANVCSGLPDNLGECRGSGFFSDILLFVFIVPKRSQEGFYI